MLIVQCDFDDTITVGNVSAALRESFGPENWREMENDYEAGKLSVEQSNIRQFGLMIAPRNEIEAFVMGNVVVRPGFGEFADYCQKENVRLVIVSSGLDIYVKTTLASLGLDHLEVHAGETCVTPKGLHISYSDLTGTALSKGFKDSYVSHFKAQGHTVVYIGDGLSDYIPAALADYVVARGRLAEHMETQGAPHYRFDSFAEVSQHIKEIRRKLDCIAI
ncbi:HAD-IB family phosphatase [Dehalococcoidia bacterium]|nr:HAD-IB family phosphatase [Dehalococcoidia bacterium]